MKFLVEVDVNVEKLARSAEGNPRADDNGLPETQGDVIALLYQEFGWLAESGVAPLDITAKPIVFTSWVAKDIHTSAAQSGHWCTDDEAEKLLNEASSQILEGMAESTWAIIDDLVSQQFECHLRHWLASVIWLGLGLRDRQCDECDPAPK